MSRDEKRHDPPFGEFSVPGPPEALRERVMQAAGAALERDPVPDRWRRVWESRAARLAWAVSVAGLLVAHAYITPRETAVRETASFNEEEITELARLPRIEPAALASVTLEPGAPEEEEDSL
jgi:hypothetical protein